jgi:outer membrane immunogenic protein
MQSKSAKRIALALVAIAMAEGLGQSAAHAQYAAPPPFVSMWNGSYVGLNAGVAGGTDAISETGFSTSPLGFAITTSGTGTMVSRLGGTAGGVAGYNWQIDGAVLGIEGDVSYVGLKGSQDLGNAAMTEHDSFQTSWLSTLRARAGYTWGGWMVYLSGGLAVGDYRYDGLVSLFGMTRPSGDVARVGWTAGIGTEWMFAPGWTTKLEYLHSDLGSATFAANVPSTQVSVTGHLTENVLRFGFNYKLGW